jgi:cation diffusion facilitator family transporter
MTDADAAAAKQSVALTSIVASGVLTVLKLAVGLATGSIGVLSEAAHSGLDFGATVITYAAIRVSDRPADKNHPYGHGKIESVAALIETGLLFATSLWIIWEATHRLISGGAHVEVTWWAAAVILVSILVDIGRSRALGRVARATRSQALEADALHFSSDILSSSVVLVGLGLVAMGYPRGDALAAIGVALFVCLAGYRLGRRTIDTLVDAAPAGVAEEVTRIVRRVQGVARVQRVRARPTGTGMFADVEVAVSRTLPLDRVSEIKQLIVSRVGAAFPAADTLVHTVPEALDDETVLERVQVIAAYKGIAIHHVTVQQIAGRLSVSLDLEVDGKQSLGQAHETASALEADIRAELGESIEVETHIEPMLLGEIDGAEVPDALCRRIARSIEEIASRVPAVIDVHDVRARHTAEGLFISFHCTFDPARTVHYVHATVSSLEAQLREEWPDARRIVAHAEPPPAGHVAHAG